MNNNRPAPRDACGRGAGARWRTRRRARERIVNERAAAWAPNVSSTPDFFDLPTKDGEVPPLIAAPWVANSPLNLVVGRYGQALASMRAIALDVATRTPRDRRQKTTRWRASARTEQMRSTRAIAGNRIRERFEPKCCRLLLSAACSGAIDTRPVRDNALFHGDCGDRFEDGLGDCLCAMAGLSDGQRPAHRRRQAGRERRRTPRTVPAEDRLPRDVGLGNARELGRAACNNFKISHKFMNIAANLKTPLPYEQAQRSRRQTHGKGASESQRPH